MDKFSLKCLGVGDGWPCADRSHAAFLYRLGKTSILIDCGEPVGRSLKAAGVKPDLIDAIFLSHLHADHVGGLFMLLQGLWLEGRRRVLPIHLPAKAVKPVQNMIQATFLFDELLKFRMKFSPLTARKSTKVRDTRVTAFPTTHLAGMRARFRSRYRSDFSAYCFLLEADGLRIGHSADLGRPEDLDPLLEHPLDLLVCEVAHFSREEIFSYLKGRRIGRIVFVHLAGEFHSDLSGTRRLAAKLLPDIPHTFPRDGDVVRL